VSDAEVIERVAPAQRAETVRRGFDSGITMPLEWRRGQLEALDRLLAENIPAIQAAVQADLGKHPLETYLAEISAIRGEIALTLKNLKRWTRTRPAHVPLAIRPASARIQRQPLGAVLIIAPWNYPVNLLLWPMVGAIAAGNTVVAKPSELAPQTSALMARLFPKYLDTRAIALVEGAVEETTELLACRWDHIFYTGNGAVGRIVLAAAAQHLTPATLELGGKSPVWVDETADIDRAASWLAWAKYFNAGQTCVAPDYVLASPAVVPPLVAALRREITALYGEDPRQSTDFGRIVNTRHANRLAGLLGSASVAIGGQSDPAERYVAPTVLENVSLDDPVMKEEIFGPILPIVPVADADEAIGIISARDKPLALYVFTGSKSVRDAFLARTTSGSMGINTAMLQLGVPAMPFGGVGASGMGAYHGEHTVRTFSHERAVLRKYRGLNLAALGRPPYTERKQRLLRGKQGTPGTTRSGS
jgi:aldehyde dehydrogenase (NAD+)